VHRLLEHTADLRAELTGADFGALCGEAVALLRELLVGDCRVEPREERRVALAGPDEAERFFRFVRELVYWADADGFLPAACAKEDGAVSVRGERFDASRHAVDRQIKALTRHHFVFERTAGGLRAELIFDL